MTAAATREKGPRVFLDYDQAELDRCYDQANWAPNQAIVHDRSEAHCAVVRQRIGEPERLAYGKAEIEKLNYEVKDLLLAREPKVPDDAAITAAVIAMLVMTMRPRPMRSERCPASGEAAKPAACRRNRHAPTSRYRRLIVFSRGWGGWE